MYLSIYILIYMYLFIHIHLHICVSLYRVCFRYAELSGIVVSVREAGHS